MDFKNVTFTICANNYLAHAKTLAETFKKYHSNVIFVIVLLDEKHEHIDYKGLMADDILWAHKILGTLITELSETYSIAELCTVIKPKLFEYFYNYGYNQAIYIDPDIKVYSEFEEVFDALKTYDLVLTPHICNPTPEIGHPQDKDLMRTGIYNLGFLAMNKTPETMNFIAWWHKRVVAYGFHDLSKGFFYDQIWLGYAPAFLDKVFILRHLGYNMANWNLHERTLIKNKEQLFVNTPETPLRFFHFSHFKIERLPEIASYNQNYNLNNREDIRYVFNNYKESLENNNYQNLKTWHYRYGKKLEENNKPEQENRILRAAKLFKKMIGILIKG